MPVYHFYADAVGNHPDKLIALIRGWRDPNTPPMRTARRLVDTFGLMPVLFRPLDRVDDDHTVTHVAICGLVVFRDELRDDDTLCSRIDQLRVERLALETTHEWYRSPVDRESMNFYVVSAGWRLPLPIRLTTIRHAVEDRTISDNLQQAYTFADLPESLQEWYYGRCATGAAGDALMERFAPLRASLPLIQQSRRPITYSDSRGQRRVVWLRRWHATAIGRNPPQ
jgi:hypothetical protein